MTFHITGSDLVDLHSHSTANDGRWTPVSLAQGAKDAGLRVTALTDHDTTINVGAYAAEARRLGLLAVPGVEVTCWWAGSIQHVLCLGVEVTSPALTAVLDEVWGETLAVARHAASNLRRRGVALPGLDQKRNGDYLPVDVISAALQGGIAPSFPAAVEVMVEQMGLSFAAGVQMAKAVAACHEAGGIAVLAHPGRAEYGFNVADAETVADMVAGTGLDGLEVYHWSHGPEEVERYGRLAATLGLLVSCGSDSHGPNSSRPLRGWEARLCRRLLERCGVEVVG